MSLIGLGAPLCAQTNLANLTPPERAAFRAEVRALLLDDPQIVASALAPPSLYSDDIATDLARIARHAPQLFAPGHPGFGPVDARVTMAFFTRADCPPCASALADLRDLAQTEGLRVTLFDLDQHAALAADLTLDTAPSYVLPNMLIRGQMPAMVLQRYIRATR